MVMVTDHVDNGENVSAHQVRNGEARCVLEADQEDPCSDLQHHDDHLHHHHYDDKLHHHHHDGHLHALKNLLKTVQKKKKKKKK